ncbi:MAG: hypothetical protein AB7F59_05245 [Bdellovibrionales bacterium]
MSTDETPSDAPAIEEVVARVLILGKSQYNVIQCRDFLIRKGIQAEGVFSLREAVRLHSTFKPTHTFISIALHSAKTESFANLLKNTMDCLCYIFPEDPNNRESMIELKHSNYPNKMQFKTTGAGLHRIVETWLREKNAGHHQQVKKQQAQATKAKAKEKNDQQLIQDHEREELKRDEVLREQERKKAWFEASQMDHTLAEESASSLESSQEDFTQNPEAESEEKQIKSPFKKEEERKKRKGKARKTSKRKTEDFTKVRVTEDKPHEEPKLILIKKDSPPPTPRSFENPHAVKEETAEDFGHVTVTESAPVEIGTVETVATIEAQEGETHVQVAEEKMGEVVLNTQAPTEDVSTVTTQFSEETLIELKPVQIIESVTESVLETAPQVIAEPTPANAPETPEPPPSFFQGEHMVFSHVQSPSFNGYAVFMLPTPPPEMNEIKTHIEKELKLHLNLTKQRSIKDPLEFSLTDYDTATDITHFSGLLEGVSGERIKFFETPASSATTEPSAHPDMISVEASRIQVDVKVNFDVYLRFDLNQKYVKYVLAGEAMTEKKMKKLTEKNVLRLHIKIEDKQKFEHYCNLVELLAQTRTAA